MAIQYSQATAEDIPGLVAITFEEFMEQDEWMRIRFGDVKPDDRLATLTAILHQDLTNPERPLVIQKAVDDTTGEIVGLHQLNYTNVPPNVRQSVEPIVRPPGHNMTAIREYYNIMISSQTRAAGDAPFLHVAELSVKKSHQRRGIASALIRWGQDYATKVGLPIHVEATPDGVPVYKKHGYETLDTFSIDLTKYGGKGPYTELEMRWTPPKV